MVEKSCAAASSDMDLQVIGGSQLSSKSSDYSVLDFIGKGAFVKVAKCVKSATNEKVAKRKTKKQAEEEDGILQKWRDFDPDVSTQQTPSENQASTGSSYGAQGPQNPLPLSQEDKSSIAHSKPLKERKRTYAEISQGCNRGPDSTSPIRKKRKICRGRPLVKRPHSEISKDNNRIPEISSPERKKRKICGDRPLLKRPYGEISEDSNRIPDISSPERKLRRMTIEVKDTELPSTSKEAPTTVNKKRKWKAITFQSDTRTSDSTWREEEDRKVTKTVTKIWLIGSSYIRRGEEAAYENFGENFGLNAKVEWFGKGGMRFSGVLPRFYAELSNTQSPPDILVIHAGGNDLGLMSAKTLASMMENELMQLHAEFPSMMIAYSCINERQVWRNGLPGKVNKHRKTVNTSMRKAVGNFGGEVIEHPSLRYFDKNIFLPDGVHFTKKGNGIFVTSIHCVLMKILQKCLLRNHS